MRTWEDIFKGRVALNPHIDACMDDMMEALDDLLWEGHDDQSWPDIDNLLATYPWEKDPENWLVVGVVSMVQPIHRSLEHYAEFYRQVHDRFGDRASSVLAGFASPL